MRKKTVPLLIVLMILALGGIMVIQLLWIKKSIYEKQVMIDQQVVQAISNTDMHLSDFGTMALITHVDSLTFAISDTLIQLHPSGIGSNQASHTPVPIVRPAPGMNTEFITIHENVNDSMMVSHTEMIHNYQSEADSIRVQLEQIEHELVQLDEVRSVFNRIKVEVNTQTADIRLDSSRVDDILRSELLSFNLDTVMNWGVYDRVDEKYIIQPHATDTFRYNIPLFKNDIIHPGRFVLSLNLENNSALLWEDIRPMIFMSVIFILIILTVFLFAVRLVIKHKKISQIKSDFINNMTHEFKTPLASISLAADSIVHPNISGDPKKIAEYVHIIHQEKSKLNQNVERILEVAALEKDALVLPVERIDLPQLITESITNLNLLLQSRNGMLTSNLAATATIQGSMFHLSQALSNVLENAIKYSPEKPVIHVSLTVKNNVAEVRVKDNGMGMTKHQVSKVFDSFYRAETGNIHNTKGFGLGLTYARFIVEKMNGHISIQSEPGKGTCVTLQFPVL